MGDAGHRAAPAGTDALPGVPDALPSFDNAIVRALRDKLERTNRIRRFKDYEKLEELGQGTYGTVHKVRKRNGGQVFAVKLWNDMDANIHLTKQKVLSELSALLKVNDGWHACDQLDRAWCPLVQLHGLFLRPRGLLMEMYGESLYDVLGNDRKRAKFYADGGVAADGQTQLFRSHVSVASNVASACRFLHDIGMMHRDLKDANVLVEGKHGRWRAKLSDFGTSAGVRTVLQGPAAGTLHAMAPEVLEADPIGQDGVTVLADARAADVYAYGILLCALWDNGQDPLRHLKVTNEYALAWSMHRRLKEQDRTRVALRRLMCVQPFPDNRPQGLRPATPDYMPDFFQGLMSKCLLYEADKRPTFQRICEDIKARVPAVPAPAADPEANLRVIAVVRYKPEHLEQDSQTMGLVFRITVSVEDRQAPLTLVPSGYVGTDGEAAFAFPFAARLEEHITLSIGTPVPEPGAELPLPQIAEFRWVGHESVELPRPAIGAPPETVTVTLTPNWAAQPLGGSKVALLLNITRTQPGQDHEDMEEEAAVAASQAVAERVLHRLQTPGRMPRELRSEFPVEYDVMLSYREGETGMAGSNFAFRLQEALELKNLNVFAYANLSQTDHWMSPQTNGVASCRVFMPIFSPQYGDLDKAPWSAAELMTAVAYLRAPGAGLSAILPVWHSGTYPPNADTGFLMLNVPVQYVPDAAKYDGKPACDMRYKHVWLIVHEALKSLLD